MALKFRKSLKIAPGVRINLTSKGISSTSIGKRGAKINIGKKGTRATVGIPGTGLSYTTPLTKKAKIKPNHVRQFTPISETQFKILWYWGILLLPVVFAWFTLNKQKFNTLERVISFAWLILNTLFWFAVL